MPTALILPTRDKAADLKITVFDARVRVELPVPAGQGRRVVQIDPNGFGPPVEEQAMRVENASAEVFRRVLRLLLEPDAGRYNTPSALREKYDEKIRKLSSDHPKDEFKYAQNLFRLAVIIGVEAAVRAAFDELGKRSLFEALVVSRLVNLLAEFNSQGSDVWNLTLAIATATKGSGRELESIENLPVLLRSSFQPQSGMWEGKYIKSDYCDERDFGYPGKLLRLAAMERLQPKLSDERIGHEFNGWVSDWQNRLGLAEVNFQGGALVREVIPTLDKLSFLPIDIGILQGFDDKVNALATTK
jgi:hypothetical protein